MKIQLLLLVLLSGCTTAKPVRLGVAECVEVRSTYLGVKLFSGQISEVGSYSYRIISDSGSLVTVPFDKYNLVQVDCFIDWK